LETVLFRPLPTVRIRFKKIGIAVHSLNLIPLMWHGRRQAKHTRAVHRPNGCRDGIYNSSRLLVRPIAICLFLRSNHACNSVIPRRIHVLFSYTSPLLVDLVHIPFCSSPPFSLDPFAMRSLITLFSLVASACAYQILSPSSTSGWTTLGRNNVTWQRVSTDADTFTMLLVNQVSSSPLFLRPGLILGCFRTRAYYQPARKSSLRQSTALTK
jgi:hypothetical protein